MTQVRPVERLGIHKHGRRLLKTDAMLSKPASRFIGVPLEHISVYTLIRQYSQGRITAVLGLHHGDGRLLILFRPTLGYHKELAAAIDACERARRMLRWRFQLEPRLPISR